MSTPSTNFLIFNENKQNIRADADYITDNYRLNGAQSGMAPSIIHNKVFYQASIMAAALAQVIVNRGNSARDDSFSNLVSAIDSAFPTPETPAQISILNGTIAHGATIPLPSGYTQDQCYWIVSMNNDNNSSIAWDINEFISTVHYKFYCSANSSRVVTAYSRVYNQVSGSYVSHYGMANYFIIGVK